MAKNFNKSTRKQTKPQNQLLDQTSSPDEQIQINADLALLSERKNSFIFDTKIGTKKMIFQVILLSFVGILTLILLIRITKTQKNLSHFLNEILMFS